MDAHLSEDVPGRERQESLDELMELVRAKEAEMNQSLGHIAELRKRVLGGHGTESDRRDLTEAEADFQRLLDSAKDLEKQMMTVAGITEEMLNAVEAERLQHLTDPVDRSGRRTVTSEQIQPTTLAEDVLPTSLERLLAKVDPRWLRTEAEHGFRLGEDLLSNPLSLIRGVRSLSETRTGHRFAQMLSVAQDFLEGREDYDFFAGAMLIPQAAALGAGLPYLEQVAGEVEERVTSLWQFASDAVDSTAYELLVAAACTRAGRQTEFLTAGSAGHGVKMPDLRIHDYGFPFVVECKRRQILTNSDLQEERSMRALFSVLREECAKRGLTGLFELQFQVKPFDVPVRDVVEAATQQPFARSPESYTAYDWGQVRFHPLPSVVDIPTTRLYSPAFLGHLFGWDTDLPPHDGLICNVDHSSSYVVDRVRAPLGLAWTNNTKDVFLRRARTASALLGKAMKQIPPGEMGAVYICYQEGDREKVADDRTTFVKDQLEKWTYPSKIRVPLVVLSRIVPRALGHGQPDLVETAMPFISELTGGSIWLEDLPTLLFT